MIKLDIVSDPICPWCYIGKANLDRAIGMRPDHPFVIEWHPFQLNPDMPANGMDRRAYLEGKFGGREGAARAYAPVAEQAGSAGLEINLDAIGTVPNTLDAHRLIHWAGQEGRQTPVVSALFRAYFREGRDIGDKAVLADIAAEAGLDRAAIIRLLEGDADMDTVRARDEHARAMGITGVPCFIVGNRHAVSGAQPPELWDNAINDILSRTDGES